jgi:hypothetical protein
MDQGFGDGLALGPQQVALRRHWRFDHGQQALGPSSVHRIRQQALDRVQLPELLALGAGCEQLLFQYPQQACLKASSWPGRKRLLLGKPSAVPAGICAGAS